LARRWVSTPVTQVRYEHAEGPSWDARTDRLSWVDQFPGLVCVGGYDAASASLESVRTYDIGHSVGAVVPASGMDDGWLLACAGGYAHLAVDRTVTMLAQPEPALVTPMRMNDGKCDRQGRFWAGSMAWDKRVGAGSLYRLDPDLTVTVALTGTTISNGMAWAPDDQYVYYIDTPTRRIDRFAVSPEGVLSGRAPVVELESGPGFPDGMCIDDEGCLWVALWDGYAVRRYAPDGELLAVVDVEAPQVTSCCFGGADGRTLFITTSQEDMDADTRARHPHSGKVFAVGLDVSGPPAAAFAWSAP
jgi:sugar lactone lactonase YvrE